MKAFHIALLCGALAGLGLVMSDAHAKSAHSPKPEGDSQAGMLFAQQMCAQCHDVKKRTDDLESKISPPSFFSIANAKTTTPMGLNAFLLSPHTDMPNFIISRKDRRNVIAYILSLRDERRSAQAAAPVQEARGN